MSTLRPKPFSVDIELNFCVDLLNFDLNNSTHPYQVQYYSFITVVAKTLTPSPSMAVTLFMDDPYVFLSRINEKNGCRSRQCFVNIFLFGEINAIN